MDERREHEGEKPHEEGYVPRPAWQVWAARLGVGIMLLLIAYQVMSMVRGGL